MPENKDEDLPKTDENEETEADGNSKDENSKSKEIDSLEDAKSVIKALREENSKRRIAAKGLAEEKEKLNNRLDKLESGIKGIFKGEDKEATSEDRLARLEEREQKLLAERESQEADTALLEIAKDNGIAEKDYEFFNYLLEKKSAKLGENEELSDADFEAIVKKVKMNSKPANSTVINGDDPNRFSPEDTEEVTLKKFQNMSISERSVLYQKDRNSYTQLFNATKESDKRRF